MWFQYVKVFSEGVYLDDGFKDIPVVFLFHYCSPTLAIGIVSHTVNLKDT